MMRSSFTGMKEDDCTAFAHSRIIRCLRVQDRNVQLFWDTIELPTAWRYTTPLRLARRQQRRAEEVTRVREGWHDSCCSAHRDLRRSPGGHRPSQARRWSRQCNVLSVRE